jgi:hypothetical protein
MARLVDDLLLLSRADSSPAQILCQAEHGLSRPQSVLLSVIFVSGRDDLRRGIPFGVLFRSFEFGALNLFGIWDLEFVWLRLRRSGLLPLCFSSSRDDSGASRLRPPAAHPFSVLRSSFCVLCSVFCVCFGDRPLTPLVAAPPLWAHCFCRLSPAFCFFGSTWRAGPNSSATA